MVLLLWIGVSVIGWLFLGALGSLLGRYLLLDGLPTLTRRDWAFLIRVAVLGGPLNVMAVAVVWGFKLRE